MLVGKPENDFLCYMARRSACHVKEKNKLVVREVIVCWLPILTLFFVHDNVKEWLGVIPAAGSKLFSWGGWKLRPYLWIVCCQGSFKARSRIAWGAQETSIRHVSTWNILEYIGILMNIDEYWWILMNMFHMFPASYVGHMSPPYHLVEASPDPGSTAATQETQNRQRFVPGICCVRFDVHFVGPKRAS